MRLTRPVRLLALDGRVAGRHSVRRVPRWFAAIAGTVAMVMAVPLAYVLIQAGAGGRETWTRLLGARLPALAWNTGLLMLTVTIAVVLLGTTLAFLVMRTDMPGRRPLRWLLALPLALPAYVGALSYVIVFGPRGWVQAWSGSTPLSVHGSLFSTALLLTLFCYPYVYLLVMSSLQRMSHSYEETARSCGLSRFQILFRVYFPMLRPAIGAGALLSALYVLSDFGAVAMLRYDTFVSAIYYQIEGRFDRAGAAALSTVLVAATLAILWLEQRSRKGLRYSAPAAERRAHDTIRLGRWRAPAAGLAFATLALGVLLPLAVLIFWTGAGVRDGALSARFWGYALNSLAVAGMVALACMAVTAPIVYVHARYPSFWIRLFGGMCFGGYALPGVVVALGVVSVFHRYLPGLYMTLAMVAFAHFMRFLPQSLGAGSAALARIAPSMDEAARSLGDPPARAMRRVIFPLMLPGVLTGGALVFVHSLKELPATLLLRPPGFDTLSVRVWIEASEGFYAMAAPAALLIVVAAALPVKWMLEGFQ